MRITELRNIDPRTVDQDSLRVIRDVQIDLTRLREVRTRKLIRQIGNPYCYRHGKYVVKVSFPENSSSLEDRLASYLSAKICTLDSPAGNS